MKTCTRCGETKDESYFYRDYRSPMKWRSTCRACDKLKESQWYNENKELAKATDRKYRQSNRDRETERYARWLKANPGKAYEYHKRNKERRPDACAARKAVNHAVEDGRISAPKSLLCAICGQRANQYHHHNGYGADHYLDVIPLCRSCHDKEHGR